MAVSARLSICDNLIKMHVHCDIQKSHHPPVHSEVVLNHRGIFGGIETGALIQCLRPPDNNTTTAWVNLVKPLVLVQTLQNGISFKAVTLLLTSLFRNCQPFLCHGSGLEDSIAQLYCGLAGRGRQGQTVTKVKSGNGQCLFTGR